MIEYLKKLYHFLGGVQFAIGLIFCAICLVIAGTLIESYTQSHLLAASWTYAHPLFNCLLVLFFINILVAALRRWPFTYRHIPFLLTHLGLLMLIAGTIIKNWYGVQGHLTVWEGSGNQKLIIPHSYSLYLEKKDSSLFTAIPLKSLAADSYKSKEFPNLTCRIIGSVPHVQTKYQTWIKNNHISICGVSPLLIETPQNEKYNSSKLIQLSQAYPQQWKVRGQLVLDWNKAIKENYLQDLTIQLRDKLDPSISIQSDLISLIDRPFKFGQAECMIQLKDKNTSIEDPSFYLFFTFSFPNRVAKDSYRMSLDGENALFVEGDKNHLEPFFTCILKRPHPSLAVLVDEQENVMHVASDSYGSLYIRYFSAKTLPPLIAYDEGFQGYLVQSTIPFPAFPYGLQERKQIREAFLIQQLRDALEVNPELSPPLRCFLDACQKMQMDFPALFVDYLSHWHRHGQLLLPSKKVFSPELTQVLETIPWDKVNSKDLQAVYWSAHVLKQLDLSYVEEKNLLSALKKLEWPHLSELKKQLEDAQSGSIGNLIAMQMQSIVEQLPNFTQSTDFSQQDPSLLFSAFLRNYGLDYRVLVENNPYGKTTELGQKNKTGLFSSLPDALTIETFLRPYYQPIDSCPKLEDCIPAVIVEIQQDQSKQTLALPYDSTCKGLKWPILKGEYLIRFQPFEHLLPYRVRLRQARQLFYPQSTQTYSYESDVIISKDKEQICETTLSMNQVYETWDGYRFYLSAIGQSPASFIKNVQLIVNCDPVKYWLTYPGALLLSIGTFLLFFLRKRIYQ